MNIIDKYNCILCKYNKYNKDDDSCFNHREKDEYGYPIGKCKLLSNIYYGFLVNFFPFKQIKYFLRKRQCKKYLKYASNMDKKYGDSSLEDDELKFIWGVKSWDDLSESCANLYTMNDIDIVYDKKRKKYILGIETAYTFKNHDDECNYLKQCVKAFTKYMNDNGMQTNKPFRLFMSSTCTSIESESIEDLYTNYKIFVDGFCNQ